MGESIWKKEISFGRKKKPEQPAAELEAAAPVAGAPAPAPAPAGEPVPFWKKEISFAGGKPKIEDPAEPKGESIWKKEISLGGKPKDPSVGDSTSIWKKEISFGSRKAEAPRDAFKPESESIWKRDISLGRKKQKQVEKLAEEAVQAVASLPVAERPVAPTHIEPEVLPELSEPVGAAEPEPATVAEPEVVYQAPPAPAEPEIVYQAPPVPETSAVGGLEPLPEPPPPLPLEVEAVAALPEAPTATPEPVVAPPPAAAAPAPPAAVAPPYSEPLPEPEPLAAAESWEEAPSLPPEAVPVAAAQVVHPPVPASELPPLPSEPKVPFWKKEIGGKKKAKAPEAATAAAVAAPVAAPAGEAKVPFWKKEIGGKKKAKVPAPQAATAAAVAAPAGEAKVPFWKKEIGGKKKAKAPQAATAAAVAAPAGEAKVPFWKKEIGGKKNAKVPKTAPVATTGAAPAAKVPFWKKEIGGKKKGAAPAAVAGPAAPKAKRELKLPSLSLSRSRAQKAGASGKKSTKAKRLVGLKIGASQIAAARVSNNGHAELMQVARQPLDQGVVIGGELRDPDALAEQLKAFFALHKLPKKNVRLGIASNRIGVRIFDVAGVTDEKQLTNAIQFRAQEALPIPLDEAVLDYHVLSESVDDEGQPTRRILLVVAYRELVDRYVSACRKAGISLLGIDLEAFALLRALAAPREGDEEPTAALVAVAVGHDRSTFAVSDGRVCEFTRVLEWGGSALNVALARALDQAPSEVEGVKRALTLDGTGELPDGMTEEQWAASLEAVRKQLQSFARELVSSLQFYQNQPGSLGIGEIVLTGGTAHLPGLADELQRLIGVRVRVGDPLARLKVSKKLGSPDQLGSYAVAIGLGIED